MHAYEIAAFQRILHYVDCGGTKYAEKDEKRLIIHSYALHTLRRNASIELDRLFDYEKAWFQLSSVFQNT